MSSGKIIKYKELDISGVCMGTALKKVLVVDDDANFSEGLALALGARNCLVDIALSGEDAVKQFRNNTYDIAFMDIKLPGKNGITALKEIREFCPAAQIVLMTGFTESSLLEQARQAGAIDILCKPFRLKDMFAFVDKVSE